MGSKIPIISRFEVTGVFTHPDAKADIVLVHGLNGHPQNTWTAKNGTFWPVQLLPESLQNEHANILVYGYNADAYSRGKDQHASHNIILQHAQTLVTNLTLYRKSRACFRNPIIWVAHSFGGILVKRALLYSNDLRATDHEEFRSIYVSTYGIVFLGTPHAGSVLANLGLFVHQASRISLPRSIFHTESALLKTLKRDNERLQEINNQFLNIYERFKIHMVYENHKTDLKITRALVVDGTSAGNPLPGATYYGIEATHSNMCKFKDISAPGYLIISTAIRDWVSDAAQVVKSRWDNEKEDRHAKIRRNIDEMQKLSISSQPLAATKSSWGTLGANMKEHEVNRDAIGMTDRFPPGPTLVGQATNVEHLNRQARIDDQEFVQSLQTIDESIHAFTAQTRLHMLREAAFDIPYPRNRWFTGREEILSDMQEFLVPTAKNKGKEAINSVWYSAKIFVIHGLPGIGKTNLALEFGYRQKSSFTHIFWISSDSEEKFDQGLYKIAQSLGLARDNVIEDEKMIVKAAMTWLKNPNPRHKWLLILDNVDNAQILNLLWSDLHCGSVLITSRDPIPGVAAVTSTNRSHRLIQLSPYEGTEFVKKRLKEKIQGDIDDASAADLAKRFAYYPLYMYHMTSFIEMASLTLDGFYEQLKSEPAADEELQDLCVDSPWYTKSVAKAIESHMAKLDPQARETLTAVAFFDPDSIPERLLLSTDGKVPCLSSAIKRQKILFSLSQPSFIYINPDNMGVERCISLHRLVRDAALRSDSMPQTAFETAVWLLRKSFPLHKMSRDHMVEDWAECEVFQPHVLALHDRYLDLRNRGALAPSFESIELIYSCAWYLCERGRFSLSKTLISTVFDDYNRLRKIPLAVPTEFLADLYTVQLYYSNETDKGVNLVELATQAMDIREDAVKMGLMDQHHPNRANGPMNVGVVLALENPEAAIHMHSRALEIRKSSTKYEADQIHGFALNYLNIGRCWWVIGELETAASCFKQCLSLCKKREAEVGKRFSLTAWALSALGIIRAYENNFVDAMKLMSEGLELHICTMGERHIKTLACYYRLGWLCQRVGEYSRARQLLSICHEAYDDLSSKPELARTKFQLSKVLKEIGAPEEQWNLMDFESRELLLEIRLAKGMANVNKKSFEEADFNNEINYYYR